MSSISLSDVPAFILGNSPYLPRNLSGLASKFTIGVNRILRTGFVPTILLWVDGNIYRQGGKITEDGRAMDESGCLLVCDSSVANREYHHRLAMRPGQNITDPDNPKLLWCDGNTGTCAARWAFALGCPKVYLVGMEAEYKEGRSDFWGDNQWHNRIPGEGSTISRMRDELARLLQDWPGQAMSISGQDQLDYWALQCPDVPQSDVKAAVRALVSS